MLSVQNQNYAPINNTMEYITSKNHEDNIIQKSLKDNSVI